MQCSAMKLSAVHNLSLMDSTAVSVYDLVVTRTPQLQAVMCTVWQCLVNSLYCIGVVSI